MPLHRRSFLYGVIVGASAYVILKWIFRKKPDKENDLPYKSKDYPYSYYYYDHLLRYAESYSNTFSYVGDCTYAPKDDCLLFAPILTSFTCSLKQGCCKTLYCSNCNNNKFLSLINGTKNKLDICVYVITSREVTKSILQLFRKGIYVRIIVDKEMSAEARNSKIILFLKEHIPIKLIEGADNQIMHNKFVIIDQNVLLTGSFNWTMQGFTGNYENGIVTRNKDVVKKYSAYFEYIWSAETKMNVPIVSCLA